MTYANLETLEEDIAVKFEIFKQFFIKNWDKINNSYSKTYRISSFDFFITAFMLKNLRLDDLIFKFMDTILENPNLQQHIDVLQIHTQLIYIYNEKKNIEIPLNDDFGTKISRILFKHMLIKVADFDMSSDEMIRKKSLILTNLPGKSFM